MSEEQNRAYMTNQTAMLAEAVGVWSLRCADSLVSWSEHCLRGNGAAALHQKMLNHFNLDDLVATRAENSTPFGQRRLNRRLPIGRVATRFEEGVRTARNFHRQDRNQFRSSSFFKIRSVAALTASISLTPAREESVATTFSLIITKTSFKRSGEVFKHVAGLLQGSSSGSSGSGTSAPQHVLTI